MEASSSTIFQEIHKLCETLEAQYPTIEEARRKQLHDLASYISLKLAKEEAVKIIVVCTHNSRRSHLGQLWLALAAQYYDLRGIETYSGGTEATALNERVVIALKNVGFSVDKEADLENPIYHIFWAEAQAGYRAFSKRYQDSPNPSSEFAAIMVCNEADESCPVVTGCEYRLALPYDDPKEFDGTDQELEKYHERLMEIGGEMMYVMRSVKKLFSS